MIKKNPKARVRGARTSVSKQLPAGHYIGKVVSVETAKVPGQLTLSLEVTNIVLPEEKFAHKIRADLDRYIVVYGPLKIYTTIAARNIHHAINKATKDCSGRYTSIKDGMDSRRIDILDALGYKFHSLAAYNKLTSEVRY